MAVIEEVEPTPKARLPPVTIEELPDTELAAAQSPVGPSTDASPAPSPDTSLAEQLAALAPRLVPDGGAADSAFQRSAAAALGELGRLVASDGWEGLSLEEQAVAFLPAARLCSPPPPSSPSSSSSPSPDHISSLIPAPPNAPSLALYLLQNPLRALFSSHPHLSASTRARPRPHGGPGALDDMYDAPAWKERGTDAALAWCATQFSPSEVERHLGLLLPPTLTMMDDHEPKWRDAGARVLSSWIRKVDPGDLRRRGLDSLLLKSLTHSLTLHADPPLPHVFPVALGIVEDLEGEKMAAAYASIMDALVAGWTYASAVPVLVDVARNAAALTAVLGVGIARWNKAIIPSLLTPLQHDPAPARLPLYEANLSALLALLHALRGSGRVDRWRGQILDVVARVWVSVGAYGYTGRDRVMADAVLSLTKDVYAEVGQQCPSVKTHEFAQLRALGSELAPLVA